MRHEGKFNLESSLIAGDYDTSAVEDGETGAARGGGRAGGGQDNICMTQECVRTGEF